ncbi:MAG: nicotinate (nicotinamide) nucleotide adenylyltransferase [Huintestinicola sp.]|uniref:nicotinate (nicotinamide) nucleotide adenylyltransferase n=1 Tax=Huintestinicola sp. TaxID=2981661 RepID=UPI003F0DB454
MITALFGGSFDPVHLGHVNAVKSLLESSLAPDRVIIMPAFVNPFKAGLDHENRADCEDRLEMCRLAFEKLPLCEISDYEIKKGTLSYTADTLEHMRALYPEDKLILTVGSDSLATLPRWNRFPDIIRLAQIAAVSRSPEESLKIEGYAEAVRASGGSVTVIETEPFDISSTEIRKKIVKNQDISCYVDKNVVQYIMSKSIYKQGDR